LVFSLPVKESRHPATSGCKLSFVLLSHNRLKSEDDFDSMEKTSAFTGFAVKPKYHFTAIR